TWYFQFYMLDHDDQIHYDVRNHDDRLFQSSNDDNFTPKA
ncbi:unnamed protein product, partial [Rotaria socialis]